MARPACLLILVATLSLVVQPGVAADPAVSITTPADGAMITGGGSGLAIAGEVAFDVPEPADQPLHFRRTNCDSDQRLSVEPGDDPGACGYLTQLLGTGEVLPITLDWPAADGLPLTLDASRPITGEFAVESFIFQTGVGQVRIDFTLSGVTDGVSVTLGTDTETYLITPLEFRHRTEFSIQPPANLDRQDFTALTMRTVLRGVSLNHGHMVPGEASWMTLPTYTASFDRSVEISVDDAGFAVPTAAQLSSDLTSWTASVPLPSAGTHTISARGRQGDRVSGTATSTITISK